jgi:antitoxin MazE
MTATIQKWGNSLALRLPRAVARQIKVSAGQSVELKVTADKLIVRPARRRPTLDELLAKVTPDNIHEEVNWGPPRGKEAW